MYKPRFFAVTGLIALAALARLAPHPWNLTPVAAMALFGGAKFSQKGLAFVVPFAALFISDLILGFHATMLFVYPAFAVVVLLGFSLRSRRGVVPVAFTALLSSSLFFFITNFGVWLVGGIYPLTPAGLSSCFSMAIPFFTNTLVGDLAYAAFLFGGFAVAEKRFPILQEPAFART